MKVIGLTGVAQSGKDTVGQIIRELLPDQHVVCESFADRLKVSAARALGLSANDDQLIAMMDQLKINGLVSWSATTPLDQVVNGRMDGRRFLQLYGTEAHREVFGDSFWVDACLPLDPRRSDCDVLVHTSVRFENEAQRVRDYGGEVWRVERPGLGAVNGHVSDAGLPDELVDRVIDNRHGLEYLRGAVTLALEPLVEEFRAAQQSLGVAA